MQYLKRNFHSIVKLVESRRVIESMQIILESNFADGIYRQLTKELVYQHRLSATGCSYQIQIIAELHDETIHIIRRVAAENGWRNLFRRIFHSSFVVVLKVFGIFIPFLLFTEKNS